MKHSKIISEIKTTEDHNQALKRIEELWNAVPKTPKGDELDVLATLVEAYENKTFPISEPEQVEAIRFRIDPDS